jgi:hypothetical protein
MFRHWDVVEVCCNGCQEVHDSPDDSYSEGEALATAHADGWVERDGEHFCPECAARVVPAYDGGESGRA